MSQYDNLCKYLAEKDPDRFASWLLGREITGTKVFKTELSLEPVRADSVTFFTIERSHPTFGVPSQRAPEQTDAFKDAQLLGATLLAAQSAYHPSANLVEGN